MVGVFFFKQKTAYEMRISDWSSDVCSSDLPPPIVHIAMRITPPQVQALRQPFVERLPSRALERVGDAQQALAPIAAPRPQDAPEIDRGDVFAARPCDRAA